VGLFVTAFLGKLNFRTGAFVYANAGHNPPLILRRQDSGDLCYEELPVKPGFVLAGMEGIKYTKSVLTLAPKEGLLLYTDGVSEAQDQDGVFYEMDRLFEIVNKHTSDDSKGVVEAVMRSLDEFVQDTPQFDDITMLSLIYKTARGDMEKFELDISATLKHFPDVSSWLESLLKSKDVGMRDTTKILIAVEEVFVNIANYAYTDGGSVKIVASLSESEISITFTDEGMPFDPVAHMDPYTSLPAEERVPGGLGIHMVKEIMDDVSYERKDNMNLLMLTKKI
jgi:sigma-B regulation protein RsbU (phosphoserine phosphatase)